MQLNDQTVRELATAIGSEVGVSQADSGMIAELIQSTVDVQRLVGCMALVKLNAIS